MRSTLVLLPLAFVLAAAGGGETKPVPVDDDTTARILRWHEAMLEANAIDDARALLPEGPGPEQLGPPRTSRAFAIVEIAVMDAIVAVHGRYEPYDDLPAPPPGTSVDAAIARAAFETLVALWPAQTDWLSAFYADDVATIPPGPAKEAGLALGHQSAAAILARRTNDGSEVPDPHWYRDFYLPPLPGLWQPDPVSGNLLALGAYWPRVEPFVIESGDQFRVPPPPSLTSAEYTQAFREEKRLGGDGIHTPTERTPGQTFIGIYWAYDGTPYVGARPRQYNQIVRALIEVTRTSDPVEVGRLLAVVNVAQADAALAAWDSKYHYNHWRPVTAIRAAGEDGNSWTRPDPTFTPLGAPASNTPGNPNFTLPFPAYPSGHAVVGAATFEIARLFYRTDAIDFTHVSDEFNGVTRDNQGKVRPLIPRHFSSLTAAEVENATSRLYLGIHWRYDATRGIEQGREVGEYVYANVYRPVKDDDRCRKPRWSRTGHHGGRR
jgi:hypothetical protein